MLKDFSFKVTLAKDFRLSRKFSDLNTMTAERQKHPLVAVSCPKAVSASTIHTI